jgi:putative acetyltransferase
MMDVTVDDPTSAAVEQLLLEHLEDMYATSPPESVHALDASALNHPSVMFFTVKDDGVVLGCGALKELSAREGEIKSMRTTAAARGRGVASVVLERILAEARSRNYTSVSLETGPQDFFAPARRLYERYGFVECAPFGDYQADPFSVFMTLALTPGPTGSEPQ